MTVSVDTTKTGDEGSLFSTLAIQAATNAGTAQTAAEVARDAAYGTARMYASTAAGLAAVSTGDYFSVPVATGFNSFAIYRADSGPVATYITTVRNAAETPAYSATGGQGDRTALIAVAISATLLAGGTANNLVDGATASNTTDGCAFAAVSVAGLYVRFDFGVDASKVVTEATWKQSTSANHGTWKWQASNDATTWTDIGSSFTLGGSTSQVQTELAAVSQGWRYYQLLGVSGAASAAPFVQEFEFKLGRFVLEKDPASPFTTGFPTSKLVAAYLFDELVGNTVYDRTPRRFRYDLDLTTPTTPNATRTLQGVRLVAGLVQTPVLPSVRTVILLYRTGKDETGSFIISGGSGSGSGVLQENYPDSEHTATAGRIAGGGVDWHNIAKRASSDQGAYETNRGGWVLLKRTMTTGYTSAFGLGGRHSTTTSRCATCEIAMAFFFNDTVDATEEAAILQYARTEGAKRGIYLLGADCPVKEDVYTIAGESNADGRALWASLSAGDQALRMRGTKILPGNGTTNWAHAQELELGYNQTTTTPATQMGPEWGVAYQRRQVGSSTQRQARILKLGKGTTYLAPSTSGPSSAASWSVAEANNSGLFWAWLKHVQTGMQEMMLEGRGFDAVKHGLWLGLNDATSTTYTVDAATYQGYLQALWDKVKAQLPGPTHSLKVYRPHITDPASNATALGHVRTAIASFDTANADVSVYDTDALAKEADNVHYNAASCKTMGIDFHG